jgi:mannose-6-phosphate isomerase-like protein (cupin superfamily)
MNSTNAGKVSIVDQELYGEWLQSRSGERFSIRVPGPATHGSYSVAEIISSPGDSTPVHLHENEDEHIVVAEGTARVLSGDKTFDAEPGTVKRFTNNSCDSLAPSSVSATDLAFVAGFEM